MLRTLLFLVFIVVGVGGYLLYDSARVEGGDYAVAEELTELAEDRSAELARARQSCEREVLLAFLAEQERRTEEQPEDVESWRVLAETHLELGLLDDVESAMEIGEPIRDAVSDQLLAHIEGGLAAVERARALGDEHADLYRIEASLIAMHIHDLVSALSVQAAAKAALDRAVEIDGNHPRVQMARPMATLRSRLRSWAAMPPRGSSSSWRAPRACPTTSARCR